MVEATDVIVGVLSAGLTAGAVIVGLGRNIATRSDVSQMLATEREFLVQKIEAAERHAKQNRDVPMIALIEKLGELVEEMREARRGG